MSLPHPDTLARSASGTETRHGVVVHYHEIGLKGRNRGFFERRLVRNLEGALAGCDTSRIEVWSGRFVVETPGAPGEDVLGRIGETFGVAALAPCRITSPDIDALSEVALELLAARDFTTFAIAARRATKDTPTTSMQINVELGRAVQDATGAAVHLDDPDVTVYVEVVGRQAIVYTDRRIGPGGLPVGVSGKVVSLLSGGIDSPVATYRLLKRGARVVLCHFDSAPFTDGSSRRKASTLARDVARWQGDTTLYLVPIGEAQREIVGAAPPDLRVVLYRRLMVRIAAAIASLEGAKALVTGDSLGQVASQTLENMICVEDAAPIPVLRPLAGFDKQEIVSEARRIGTYETSILPYEDCCAMFVPRSPATRASVDACREAEATLDVAALIRDCVSQADVERLVREPCGGGVSA